MSICQYTFEVPAAVWMGLIAVLISFLQLKIANTKIKLDLYDKRFRIYQAVVEFINIKHDDADLPEAKKKIHIAFRESHFLFRKNDHMSTLVLEIQSVKEDILKYESKDSSTAYGTYASKLKETHDKRHAEDLDKLTILIPAFEKIIAKYIEFRSISGFDITGRKSGWL
jgi:hypothetical protein